MKNFTEEQKKVEKFGIFNILSALGNLAEEKGETAKKEEKAAAKAPKEEIDIDYFSKVELAAAKVLECVKVEKSSKLLKLTLDVGGETRTVVSGIAQSYAPEELIGKTVVIVKNLKPAKLMGIESRGMILCGEDNGNIVFVTPEKELKSGSEIR